MLRRQDTWSDLQLVLVVNLTVITLFGWIKSSVVDALDTTLSHEGPKPFWLSIYEVRWHSHAVCCCNDVHRPASAFQGYSCAITVCRLCMQACDRASDNMSWETLVRWPSGNAGLH